MDAFGQPAEAAERYAQRPLRPWPHCRAPSLDPACCPANWLAHTFQQYLQRDGSSLLTQTRTAPPAILHACCVVLLLVCSRSVYLVLCMAALLLACPCAYGGGSAVRGAAPNPNPSSGPTLMQKCIAEAIGTGIIVGGGCGAVCTITLGCLVTAILHQTCHYRVQLMLKRGI